VARILPRANRPVVVVMLPPWCAFTNRRHPRAGAGVRDAFAWASCAGRVRGTLRAIFDGYRDNPLLQIHRHSNPLSEKWRGGLRR
jgi:hypothetical protein